MNGSEVVMSALAGVADEHIQIPNEYGRVRCACGWTALEGQRADGDVHADHVDRVRLDALLSSGLLIPREQLEQVGWVWTPHHADPDPDLCFADSRGFSRRWGAGTRPSNDAQAVFVLRETERVS